MRESYAPRPRRSDVHLNEIDRPASSAQQNSARSTRRLTRLGGYPDATHAPQPTLFTNRDYHALTYPPPLPPPPPPPLPPSPLTTSTTTTLPNANYHPPTNAASARRHESQGPPTLLLGGRRHPRRTLVRLLYSTTQRHQPCPSHTRSPQPKHTLQYPPTTPSAPITQQPEKMRKSTLNSHLARTGTPTDHNLQ